MKACNKARELYELKQAGKETGVTFHPGYFFVHVDYSLVKVSTNDIMYIEGLKDYIKIHLKSSQKPIVTRMPMKTVEEQLPASSFLRIHKSYIISIAFITAIRKSSVFVGSLELPVSDNYKDAITLLTGKFPPPGRS